MKNYILILCACCFFQNLHAQKDVTFKINHLLGSTPLAFNQTATNNIGDDFQITRLQYYISDIILFHDNTQTAVTGKFILADASVATSELLGNFNINTLDSISFGIGVGVNENHLDPASYPAAHPLAPKAPSMHWGWTPGYRFVVIEGLAGPSMTDVFEMHGLGDKNYMLKTIATHGATTGNNLDIILEADYIEALKDINLSGGVVSHGENGAALASINNFNLYVFTDASNSVPITKIEHQELALYPNPIKAGSYLTIELDRPATYSLNVYDFTGKLYKNYASLSDQQAIQFDRSGLYIVTVLNEGQIIHSQKVTVHE